LAELQLGHEDLADRNGGVSTGTSRKPRSADLVVVAGRVGALLVVQMWTRLGSGWCAPRGQVVSASALRRSVGSGSSAVRRCWPARICGG
jgi:hypothetical protein